MIATISPQAVELGLSADRVDEPVFSHSTLFILKKFVTAVNTAAAFADNFDDKIGRSVKIIFLQSRAISISEEKNIWCTAVEIRPVFI